MPNLLHDPLIGLGIEFVDIYHFVAYGLVREWYALEMDERDVD